MKRFRRNHAPEIKVEAAVRAIRGDKTLAGLTQQHEATKALDRYFHCYDYDAARRPHQGLAKLTPSRAQFGKSELRQAA